MIIIKKEYLRIENGSCRYKNQQLYDFELWAEEKKITGVFSDTSESLDVLLLLLTGKIGFQKGNIVLRGKKISTADSQKFFSEHTGVIDDHTQLVEGLSLPENLCILRKHIKRVLVHPGIIQRQAEKILSKFHLQYLIHKSVYQLTRAECFYLELLKAYLEEKDLVILDCRHIDLSEQEFKGLCRMIRILTEIKIQFIFMSCDPVILRHVDRIHLMKRNRTALIRYVQNPMENEIWKLIKEIYHYDKAGNKKGMDNLGMPIIFSVQGLSGKHFRNLSVKIRKKEAVCIIVRNGMGYLEIQDILYGRSKVLSGHICFYENLFRFTNMEKAVDQGICFIDGSIRNNTLFPELSVFDNLCMVKGRFVKKVWRNRRFRKNIEEFAEKKIGKNVVYKKVKDLTALEACQVMYYKWYLLHPDLAICMNPFGGADLETSLKIKQILYEFVEQGISVLILTQNEFLLESWNVEKIFV